MKGKLLVVLILWALSASADLLACGNKFLVPSRGTRFGKVAVARQEAAILVYANPESTVAKAMGDVPVEMVLLQAGYLPTRVSDPEELDQALRQGGWDLVLADLDDSATLRWQLEGNDAPTVVPVLYEPTKSAMAQARKDYGRAIKAPLKSQRFLETIDDAVAMRGEAQAAQ